MPTYHTDYLLGNDTTGDGTAALPWKTIARAYTSAVSNDIIKVAGSTISDVPSITLTPSNITGTFTSNIDATGILAAGDVISLTHPEFGADKFFYRVHSVAGTTIVLNGSINTGIAYPVRKFNQIHYATSTTTTFESVASVGKDRIRLLGGWNSTFTEQNGWTVARFQSTIQFGAAGTFFSPTTGGNANTYRERFCFVSLGTGFGGSINQEYYGDMIGSRTNSMFGGTPRNEVGYEPKFYMNMSNCQSGTSTLVNNDGTFGLNISEFYATTGQDNNASTWSNCGFNVDNIYLALNSSNIGNSSSRAFCSSNPMILGNLNVYTNAVSFIKLSDGGAASNVRWNGTLNITGVDTNPGIFVSSTQGNTIFWKNPTQNVSQFRLYQITNTGWAVENAKFAITDIEGNKVLTAGGLVYIDTTDYLTGTNSMKITRYGQSTGRFRLAQFRVDDSSTTLTITMTAKSSVSNTEAFSIRGFGVVKEITLPTRTIGTSWNTYTWTISGAELTSLKNSLPLLIWDNTGSTPYFNLWVDDVVITQS